MIITGCPLPIKLDFHLDVADQFKENDGIEAAAKDGRDQAKVKRGGVDDEHREQKEETKVQTVKQESIHRTNEGFRHLEYL